MRTKPYLLLDAGGTLVFPDQTYLKSELSKKGIHLTDEQLYREYYQSIYEFDQKFFNNSTDLNNPWPDGYVYTFLLRRGIAEAKAREVEVIVSQHHLKRSLWMFTFPWIFKSLQQLQQAGYRMSILSNSDGRTEEIFCSLGLRRYFEFIFDSQKLEVEKPDPKIFVKVMERLQLSPGEMLYIGDIYTIDILGANRAGVAAIHIDPFQLYTGWAGVHLRDIRRIRPWLTVCRFDIRNSVFFPLRIWGHSKQLGENNHVVDDKSMFQPSDECNYPITLELV
jgi:HAD superfamily hydrolase (TIGR01662 family)